MRFQKWIPCQADAMALKLHSNVDVEIYYQHTKDIAARIVGRLRGLKTTCLVLLVS